MPSSASRSARASARGNDALLGQHHEVRVVDRHQRRQQQLLGVFEVFVEDVRDVFGRELHLLAVYCPPPPKATADRLRCAGGRDATRALFVSSSWLLALGGRCIRSGAGDRRSDRRALAAGRDHPRSLGHQPHLRAERSRPVLRAGLRRREGSAVPVRDLAAAGDRHGRRDPWPARADARSRRAAASVPRRPGRRAESLSPARQGDHRSLRARRECLHRRDRAQPGAPADRVQDARHQAGTLDAGRRDLAAPGADVERQRGSAAAARDQGVEHRRRCAS